MGTFIDVSVDQGVRAERAEVQRLVALCPVDVFVAEGDGLRINDDKVDECTLCGLCWEAFPNWVKVSKLY